MPSLQDQLLKAGMVDEKKKKQIEKQQRKEARQRPKGQQAEESEAKQQARQTKAERAAKDKDMNRQREQQAQDKAIAAQIRQLINTNKLPRNESDIAYQFAHGKKIKKIYVTEAQQNQLTRGVLAIVNNGGQYELVPAPVADKIAQRDAAVVIVSNTPDTATSPDDDPYADYQIPDDLMW